MKTEVTYIQVNMKRILFTFLIFASCIYLQAQKITALTEATSIDGNALMMVRAGSTGDLLKKITVANILKDRTFTGLTTLEQLKLGSLGVTLTSITSDGTYLHFWSGTTELTPLGSGSGSSTWGSITGTLSSQTDLVSALAAKVNTSGAGTVFLAPNGSAASLTGFPTLNQNTTGSAAKLTTPRAIYGNNFDGSADVTGLIIATYGGTNNAYFQVSGPTSSIKTYTFPNANATIARTDAAQTFTGSQTFGSTIIGNISGNAQTVTGVYLNSGSLILNGANSVSFTSFGTTNLALPQNGTLATTASNITGTADNISGIALGANGGTGVANTGKTITIGGNFTTAGTYPVTLTATNTTSVTLPVSGRLLSSADTISASNYFVKLVADSVQHTAAYTVSASDIYKDQHCLKTTGSMAITIPPNLSAWPIGTWMSFWQEGDAILVFKKGAGVRFAFPKDSVATSYKNSWVQIKKIGTNAYSGVGALTE
jgi:hypothetical protein